LSAVAAGTFQENVMSYRRVLAMVAVTVIAGASISVFAHMKFEKSAPAVDSTVTTPPTTIQVWFTEEPDVKVSKLELRGPATPVKTTQLHAMGKSLMATVAEPMVDGVYTVSWQSAGKDGHIQKGDLTFTLKTK
jgi:copper resistance protein C